ncbi:hypothetical protein, partial [Pseudomonas sp. GP01-A4]|uniref:hypothetical protein n=1 Tax=Pseudomonas sp. GP01-A4 TaxID=2070571 RepID=UPI001C491A1F
MSADALDVRTTTRSTQSTRRRWLTPAGCAFAGYAALLYSGWHLPTERYITPQRGAGYLLGILGGSMMLLLFM